MPTYVGDALRNLTYEDLISWLNISSEGTANIDAYLAESAKYGIDEMQAVEDMASTYMNFYKNGDGSYTITSFNSDVQINNVNPVDSNMGTISRGNVQVPLNRGIDSITNKLNITRFPASGSFSQQAGYVLGSAGSAVAAVSTGITLGKVIDGALYNANPNFWDSLGLSSINPETWNSITNGDDSWQAGLFNLILGLDPNTGNSQLYMDENAFAYMAYAMAQNGIFDTGHYESYIPDGYTPSTNIYEPIKTINATDLVIQGTDTNNRYMYTVQYLGIGSNESNLQDAIIIYMTNDGFYTASSPYYNFIYCVVPNNVSATRMYFKETRVEVSTGNITTRIDYGSLSFISVTVNGQTFKIAYGVYVPISNYSSWVVSAPRNSNGETYDLRVTSSTAFINNTGYVALFGDTQEVGGIDGITNLPNATLPDISNWNSIPNTLSSLQDQYPDLWNNPLVWDNYQPDGTNPQKVYIPVATPNSTTGTYAQPTSSNSTQTNPQVNPSTSAQPLIDFLTNVMTQPNPQTNPQTQTQTDMQPKIPTQNPVDTGTGTTPTPIPPNGSASALWSVYHPSQGQVDSFGAWLWTGDIITQIQQLLQNPMEGIITLHKVFATPVDSGTGTIVVGRLNSNVPSATVTQQYVTVDCGSIDCYEEFGNVFDYSPYTDVSLYLPFIGIVPLNVNDVMRSKINVTYGVDVFTGACLAMVEVSRDGNTINLYQYAGMASVEYPLTGSVHSGLITGLLGIAGSVAATVATGGVGAPAAIAAVGGLASAGTSHNARAGGFSGNAGAMGIKNPYLIIERPQTKIAETFPELTGYPTNYSCKLNECSGHVVVKHVHVEGINATDSELDKINSILMSGIIV